MTRVLVAIGFLSTLGCASIPTVSWPKAVASPSVGNRTELVMTALPSALQSASGTSCPAIAARLYFFGSDDSAPIHVTGDLTLVARGESSPPDAAPVGEFHVTADRLSSHIRKDVVGDAYVFWLPLSQEDRGAYMLEAVLRDSGGQVISSALVRLRMDQPPAEENTPINTATRSSSSPATPAR